MTATQVTKVMASKNNLGGDYETGLSFVNPAWAYCWPKRLVDEGWLGNAPDYVDGFELIQKQRDMTMTLGKGAADRAADSTEVMLGLYQKFSGDPQARMEEFEFSPLNTLSNDAAVNSLGTDPQHEKIRFFIGMASELIALFLGSLSDYDPDVECMTQIEIEQAVASVSRRYFAVVNYYLVSRSST